MSGGGDEKPEGSYLIPSPLVTKRNRTPSVCERIVKSKTLFGTIKSFCREKGHGFITPEDSSSELIFVHVSDVEDEYVPLPGDKVKYQLCPTPPRFEKFQAVHVSIVDLRPEVHRKWESFQQFSC